MKGLVGIVLAILALGFLGGFFWGRIYEQKKNIKKMRELKGIVDRVTAIDDLEHKALQFLKEHEKNGCCGCHESREIFEKSYKALSNIPCKSQQKTMPKDVCQSDNTEEQNEVRPK